MFPFLNVPSPYEPFVVQKKTPKVFRKWPYPSQKGRQIRGGKTSPVDGRWVLQDVPWDSASASCGVDLIDIRRGTL